MGITLPTVCQITDSHCGPAVIELLMAAYEVAITQEEVVTAARTRSRIKKFGTRPDQLAHAVDRLFPNFQFWFKQHTSPEDIDTLIHRFQIPVAVNWQGLFYDTLEEEKRDFPKKNVYGDHGHYSVITDIDLDRATVTIHDTYSDYYLTPRVFGLDWFESRWWDKDVHIDKKTGKNSILSTDKLSFIIVPRSVILPQDLGFQLPNKLPTYKATKANVARTGDGSNKPTALN